MVTVANANMAHNRVVIAKVALKVGQVVKLVRGTAKGQFPQVEPCTDADLADAKIVKGVATFIHDNDLATPFLWNRVTNVLTTNTGEDGVLAIPAGEPCVFWYNKPVITYHKAAVDVALDMATVREGDQIAFDASTGLPAPLVATGVDAERDVYAGTVYEVAGPQLTILFNTL
jgi:hypothetical protein